MPTRAALRALREGINVINIYKSFTIELYSVPVVGGRVGVPVGFMVVGLRVGNSVGTTIFNSKNMGVDMNKTNIPIKC